MSSFIGSPGQFLSSIVGGGVSAASAASVSASGTTFTPISASTPRQAITVFHGNSLTLDYSDTLTTLLAGNQASHPLLVWYGVNKGTGGISTPALASEFLAVVHRFYNQKRVCLLQFQELGNHIQNLGGSFATVRDATISYLANARSLGWKVAFHAPTPRAQKSDNAYSGSFSAWDPGRKATFDACRDYFLTHTEHADFTLDLAVQELSNPFDLTYYDPDGCHFTAAGILAKAAIVAAANASWVF